MYKRSLLSSMAATAIVLFNMQIHAHAETLEVSDGKTVTESGKTYEILHALKSGQITGTSLKITGNKETNTDHLPNHKNYVVTAEGSKSAIELLNHSTIKGIDSDIRFGLEAKDSGTIKMEGGSITVSNTGAEFTKSKNNKLSNVRISSGKNETPLVVGVTAHDESHATLENVIITQAKNGIIAYNNSEITISGGSFESISDSIQAKRESSITLDKTVITSSHGNGVYVNGSGSKVIMIGGSVTAKNEYYNKQHASSALLAKNSGEIEATDVTLTTDSKASSAVALGLKSKITLHGKTTINNTLDGLGAADGGKITSEDLTIVGGQPANPELDTERSGVWAEDSESEINLIGTTTIQNVDEGLYADGGGKIISGNLTITGGESEQVIIGVNIWQSKSKAELNGNTTIKNIDVGLSAIDDAIITTGKDTKNKIEAKRIVLAVANGGHIDLANTSATAEVAGLQFANKTSNDLNDPSDPQKSSSNKINLINTKIHTDNGTGILVGAFVEKSIENSPAIPIGTLNLKDSEIHADMLLDDGIIWNKISWEGKNVWDEKKFKEIANGSFTLNADHSTLEGRANIAKERNIHFDLKNGTQWFLKTSTQEKDKNGKLLDIAQRSRSDISTLDLENSSVIFNEPTADGYYHTLHIGSGQPDTKAVYNASGNTQISFNTWWSDGKPIAEQKTDRLLINGDVSGKTNILVNLKGNTTQKNISGVEKNARGLSLIQVSGKAKEGSFQLAHGYTTINGSPNKYMLRAYGPNSSQGKAEASQSLVENSDNFWDFRLQPEFLNSNPENPGSNPDNPGSNPDNPGSNPDNPGSNPGPNPDPEQNVQAVVPQMANYLLMPNALFYTGLIDMAKQNALLADMRTSVLTKQQEKHSGFFLYTYGGTGTLSSENAPRQYGYSGADLRYAALQGGVNFTALEGQNTTTRFGLIGTYGQLSFTPKEMQDASKSTVDKWSIAAYGSIQHNSGFYIDTLLSYGILKGDITNAIIGKTATLKNAKMLNISTTVGKQFATGIPGVIFEPQAQLAYQHLLFDKISDADNLTIDMNNPHQWIMRVGGRLTKTVTAAENGRSVSFYGKVNAVKTFGDDQTIHIDKDYKLDPMGSFLEGGLGISAQMSQNVSLHGDVSYQQKLQKTGISGASFSGGIRYQF